MYLLEQQGSIDLFFSDECAFNLTPSIPYGWQLIGEQLTIRIAKDRVTNLFGLLSVAGKLKVYSTLESVNIDFIIECMDEIADSINRPTIVVLDNAPWHKAQKVLDKQEEWN